MSAICYTRVKSPVGSLLLTGDESGLHSVTFGGERAARPPRPDWREDPEPLAEAMRQLEAYFAGELRRFDLALNPTGTPFQLQVWRELEKIPYGGMISYGELARRIGKPDAPRAVGLANGANPIPIIIPCHRVVGSTGKLTGYGGGLEIKEKLLALEQRQLVLS